MRRISLFVLCFAGVACATQSPRWSPPVQIPELPLLLANIQFKTGSKTHVDIEAPIAVTDLERSTGLMYRRQRLNDAQGMLFVMEKDADHSFWMKNTYIPLDMVFVDAGGRVVGILDSVEPHTEKSRAVGHTSRFVIEVDAGWCQRNRVRTGTTVVIHIAQTPSG